MEWFNDLTEFIEGAVAWGTFLGWAIKGAFMLAEHIRKRFRQSRRRRK